MPATGPVAIIGAGISGLSCAQALKAEGVETHLFESAAQVGGRCATRLWQGHLVDYGVQYFTAQTQEFKRELLTGLRQFRPIAGTFLDGKGKTVHSSDGPRLYVLQGNNYFAQIMARGLDVRLNTPVEAVSFKPRGVECMGRTYRAVVSSLPAPQTVRLFALTQPATEYVSCVVVLLEYTDIETGEMEECYARALPEGSEPLLASYCENHKISRVIGDKMVFVALAGPKFSADYDPARPDDFLPRLTRAHEELWKIPSGKCTASYGYRWSLSSPNGAARKSFELPPGAFVCGDSRSEPTVEQVWQDGRRAAQEVVAYLAS